MSSSENQAVQPKDDAIAEITGVLHNLKVKGKLEHQLDELLYYVCDLKRNSDKTQSPELSLKLRVIRALCTDPKLLVDHLVGELNAQRQDQDSRSRSYNPPPTKSQQQNAIIITKIMTIVKEWIYRGEFDDIGEKSCCHQVMVRYLTDLNTDWTASKMPTSLAKLYAAIEFGDMEAFTKDVRETLINLRDAHPELFSVQIHVPNLETTIKEVIEIVNEVILKGSYADLGDKRQCMLAASKILSIHISDADAIEECQIHCCKIISMHESGLTSELEHYIRKLFTDLDSPKTGKGKWFAHYAKDEYKNKIEKVVQIVTKRIVVGAYDDIDEDKNALIMSAIAYLEIKERDWNKETSNGNNGSYFIPKEHKYVLMLHEENDVEGLVKYIRKLLTNAKTTYAIDRMELRLQKIGSTDSSLSRTAENAVAMLGTTLTAGLSTLHTLAPVNDAFKSVIVEITDVLNTSAFSSWAVVGGVAGGFAIGICVWNAFCVMRRQKTLKQAGKDTLDSVGPMAIGSAVAYIAVFALGSVAPPILISLLIFGAVGLTAHFISRPVVNCFTRWLFFDLPEQQALKKSYAVLNISPTATDEELRRAYRNETRRFHPDMNARTGNTDDHTENLFGVQRAYEYIVTIRLRDMNRENQPGFFARLRKFMTNLWRNDDENGNIVPLDEDF